MRTLGICGMVVTFAFLFVVVFGMMPGGSQQKGYAVVEGRK